MENESLNLDAPYSLADIEEQHRRLLLLNLPHMAPLTHYLNEIRREDGDHLTIPNFDPCDGGVNAKGLFLLDSPDYAAVGSGFVSRNNMDHASKNLCIFMQRAGIDRRDTLIWNLTPWRLTFGDDPVTDRAFSLLERLIKLLPRLRVITLVGERSQSTVMKLRRITRVQVLKSPWPFFSDANMRDDEGRNILLKTFEDIAGLLDDSENFATDIDTIAP